MNAHIMVADYMVKIFLKRKKSAIVFTSSMNAHVPGCYVSLYHSTKNSLSSFATSLFAEYRGKIDVLAVHPSAVSSTKFCDNEEMKVNNKKLFLISDLQTSVIAVSPH